MASIKGKYKVTFQESGHVLKIDGRPVPSVTKIAGLKEKGEQLRQWAVNQGINYLSDIIMDEAEIVIDDLKIAKTIYRKIFQQAGNEGKQVHKAIQLFFQNRADKIDFDSMNENVKNAVNAFMDGPAKLNLKPLHVETPVGSKKFVYAGLLDFIEEELILDDWKSGTSIHDADKMQQAAYWIAYEEMTGKKLKCARIWRLDKKTAKADPPYIMERAEMNIWFRQFKHCLGILKTDQEIKGL